MKSPEASWLLGLIVPAMVQFSLTSARAQVPVPYTPPPAIHAPAPIRIPTTIPLPLPAAPAAAEGVGMAATAAAEASAASTGSGFFGGLLAFLGEGLVVAGPMLVILWPQKLGYDTPPPYHPPPVPPPPPPPPDEQRQKDSCRSRYPTHKVCEKLPQDYIYRSMQQALNAIKASERNPNLTWHNQRRAIWGPCPVIGDHYNVRPGRVASIGCCPCCPVSDVGLEQERCGIIW